MTFDLEIAHSNVHVTCNVNRNNPNDLAELRMRALEIAKGYVNLISFKLGRAFHVSLDRCIPPEGGPETTILIHNPLLESAATVFADISNFEGIDTIALADATTMRLLDDLIMGYSSSHIGTINCARVVEGIKHKITPHGSEAEKWRKMQAALNVDRQYLVFITATSTDHRHGHLPVASAAKLSEILLRSWTIMNRFLAYQKSGFRPLTVSEYPLLTG
jgi:hypothetical protein